MARANPDPARTDDENTDADDAPAVEHDGERFPRTDADVAAREGESAWTDGAEWHDYDIGAGAMQAAELLDVDVDAGIVLAESPKDTREIPIEAVQATDLETDETVTIEYESIYSGTRVEREATITFVADGCRNGFEGITVVRESDGTQLEVRATGGVRTYAGDDHGKTIGRDAVVTRADDDTDDESDESDDSTPAPLVTDGGRERGDNSGDLTGPQRECPECGDTGAKLVSDSPFPNGIVAMRCPGCDHVDEPDAFPDVSDRDDVGRGVSDYDRVLVDMRGTGTKRTGEVIDVRPGHADTDELEYVVDLDSSGHAHVTRDAIRPVDEIVISPSSDDGDDEIERGRGVETDGGRDSYAVLQRIRALREGDEIRVMYQRPALKAETLTARVTSTTDSDHPLVDLEYLDGGPEGTLALEYDEHYSDGTPYNLRELAAPRDGANVLEVDLLDGDDEELIERLDDPLLPDGGIIDDDETMRRYAVAADVDVETSETRIATSADEAEAWARDSIEDVITNALRRELVNGDVDVEITGVAATEIDEESTR